MRILDFFIKKRDASLIEQLNLEKFLQGLNEEESKNFKKYCGYVLNDNRIKIKDFENKTTVMFRAESNIESSSSNQDFLIRSGADFLTDTGEYAINEENYLLAEKILLEAIDQSQNDFDTHYVYEKLIFLYGKIINTNPEVIDKYIDICKKDIEVFLEIRKSSHSEFITIAKRSYKAALISEEEYKAAIQKSKKDIMLPVSKSIKILVELYIKTEKFDKAIEIVNRGLCYDVTENDVICLEELKKKAEILLKEFEDKKIENKIKELEIKLDKNVEKQEMESEVEIKKSEPDLKRIEELDRSEKKARYFEEIYRIQREIIQNIFIKNNSIEKAKEKLIKIISIWERGGFDEELPPEMFFMLTYIYYYEENDEKALKVILNYIKAEEKISKESLKIKKAEKLKTLIETKQLKRDYVFTGPDKEEYKKLITLATEEYKNKNYDKAAYLAKKAKEISDTMDIYPNISEVLKIPMYLQKAKRYEEAWAVYNKLLEERFKDNSDYLGISKIYDKMRIQLQSEKKFGDALIMGIYSYMWDAAELKKTGNSAQYEKYTFKVELIKLAENLLKKTKQESAKDQIADIIGKYIKTLPELDKERFEKEIFECIESDIEIEE